MSELKIGKFQVQGTLGTGAHSTILHIRRSADSKQYALKVVPIDGADDNKFLEQAKHEVRVGEMIDHPNCITIHGLELVRDWLFRVKKAHVLVEYVNGSPLDKVPRLRLPHLVQVFVQIAAGMCHLHHKGIYHADLKPNNVMLSKANEVKIIDYGLSWIKGEGKDRVQGTPEYMAPEQVKNKFVNERSDIYNFGALMYRMLTWRHPPSVVSDEDGGMVIPKKMFQRIFEPIETHNPKVPKELTELVHSCLSYEARFRPERMSVLQGQLDHLADDLIKKPEDQLETLEW